MTQIKVDWSNKISIKKLVADGTKIELEPMEVDTELWVSPDYSKGHCYIAVEERDQIKCEENNHD